MGKLAAFDLEIATEIPVGTKDFRDYAPYGITCAAIALETGDGCHVEYWNGIPRMSQADCCDIVDFMFELVNNDYKILTWNGTKFDFFALAQESSLYEDCASLAFYDHVDLMLQFTFTVGHFLGLDKALAGAQLDGKVHDVTLSTGKKIHDMHGSKAPRLWKQGECEAVLEYLEGDVTQLLALAKWVQHHKRIYWTSSYGNECKAEIPELLTVKQCFEIPEPDVSWMDNPPTRNDFVDWILDPKVLEA